MIVKVAKLEFYLNNCIYISVNTELYLRLSIEVEMMTIASKNFSNELINAYKSQKLVMLVTDSGHITGTVAAVKDDLAYINQPAKGVTVINLNNA